MANPIMPHELRDSRGGHFIRVDDLFIDEGYCARLTPAATVAYLFLCRRADKAGVSFPGADDWQQFTGLSRPTVRASIAQLIEAGLVSIERRPGSSHVYSLEKIFPDGSGEDGKKFATHPERNLPPTRKEICHEVDTTKNTQTSNGDARRNIARAENNFSIDVGTDQERSDRWDAKISLFDAYCRGAGIRSGSAEMERKRSFAYADLDAVYLLITPDKLEAMAARLAAIYRDKGITKTPTIGSVLESESEFDREHESPPDATAPKPRPKPSRLTPEQLERKAELREKFKAAMNIGGVDLTESEGQEFQYLINLASSPPR